VFIALLALGIAVMVLGVVQRLRPPATMYGRVLGLSFAEFEERIRDAPPAGMLDTSAALAPAHAQVATTWIVCDTADTALIVEANATTAGLERVRGLHYK